MGKTKQTEKHSWRIRIRHFKDKDGVSVRSGDEWVPATAVDIEQAIATVRKANPKAAILSAVHQPGVGKAL